MNDKYTLQKILEQVHIEYWNWNITEELYKEFLDLFTKHT